MLSMKKVTAHIIRKTTVFVTASLLLLVGMSISNILYANNPAFYIWNGSGLQCTVSYFANEEGAWSNPKTVLEPAKLIHSNLHHNKIYHAAIYHVIVGRKLGKFYCTATIELPAFGKQAILLSHQGNCHYTHTRDGQLAMVIEPAKNDNAKNLLTKKLA